MKKSGSARDSVFLSYYQDEADPESRSLLSQSRNAGPSMRPVANANVKPRGKSMAGQQQQSRPLQPPPRSYQQSSMPNQQRQMAQTQNTRPVLPIQHYPPSQQQHMSRQQSRPPLAVNVYSPPRLAHPPMAAFSSHGFLPNPNESTSPIANRGQMSPFHLSPHSPMQRQPARSNVSNHSAEGDDRYAQASNVGSNVQPMDFWKRFSMVLHDAQADQKPVEQKDTWLRRQMEARKSYKTAIWILAILILAGVGGGLAWHFTHRTKSNAQPSQHDFGLGPGSTSSAVNLATLSVVQGPQKRSLALAEPTSMPSRRRTHRKRRSNGHMD